MHGDAAILKVFFFFFGHIVGLITRPIVHLLAAVCNGLNGSETKDGFLTYPHIASPMGDAIER